MIGLIENKLKDGTSQYDIRMGCRIIWTDATDEEQAIIHRDTFYKAVTKSEPDEEWELDEEITVNEFC